MVRVRHERPDPATSLEVKVPMQLALGSGKRVAVSALSLDGIRLAENRTQMTRLTAVITSITVFIIGTFTARIRCRFIDRPQRSSLQVSR